MNQEQHIEVAFSSHSDKTRSEYRAHLNATIDCVRFLLKQGLAFRGHDKSKDSSNRGNFLELLHFLADRNEDISAITFENAPRNLQLISKEIQKDIITCASVETTNIIVRGMGDVLFSILIDESRDITSKEQMAVVLRYVDKNGYVVECFIGIEHVTSTAAISLRETLDKLFCKHGLSMSRLRGQGYDGASNMRGEFNGLKALILEENKCAYFIHCFAHQLQLVLISVVKKNEEVNSLFNLITMLVNVVGASAKLRDILQEEQARAVIEALNNYEISSERGLNQEITLKRPADTRWGSHYGTLLSIINMFSSITNMLEIISNEGNSEQRFQATTLLKLIQSFDFIFSSFLIKSILGFAHELSQSLQRKDQDIVNAMNLIEVYRRNLQKMRENGWDSLLCEVSSYCGKHDIDVPNMDDIFLTHGRSQRKGQKITNTHRFRVELFYTVLDMQLQEPNNHFNETTTELLLCLACLCPNDSFAAFDKHKLLRLAEFYPDDFSSIDLMALEI